MKPIIVGQPPISGIAGAAARSMNTKNDVIVINDIPHHVPRMKIPLIAGFLGCVGFYGETPPDLTRGREQSPELDSAEAKIAAARKRDEAERQARAQRRRAAQQLVKDFPQP